MADQKTTTGTTYDKERGRVDWGVTSEQTVIYHTAWPNRPHLLLVGGLYQVSVSSAGFRLDRKPDEPVVWVAQEHPAIIFDINDQEICDALAAVGAKGCKLVICTPTEREFVWRREENSMLSVAGEGVTIMRSEKHRNAGNKVVGAAPKLVGRTLDIARKHWADPAMTARQAHEASVAESGVKFSSRLMWQLGKKSDAEATLTLPPPAKSAPKKPKPKRRKQRIVKKGEA